MRIIDIHTHIDKHFDGRLYMKPEQVIAYAENCGITRLVTLGDVLRYGQRPTEEQVREINDSSWALLDRFPGKITGLCFISALLSEAFIREELERCIARGPFAGIKCEFPNAAGRDLDIIMAMAKKLDVFVLQHAWDTSWMTDTTLQSDPSDIAELASRHPDVRIIMAHLTGCGIRGPREIADCPNVWVDTSGSQPFANVIEDAVEYLGVDRVIFGSDGPMRDFAAQLGRIMEADISESQREKILYHNAAGLLGLEQE